MRNHALIGVLLVPAALALPPSADGQAFTALSANLSFGLFDGVRIGLTHRAGYLGYDDYCWDEAWNRRWNRDRLGWDGYGSPSYHHLSFYHDCVNGGLTYAYQRLQRRSIRAFQPYRAFSRAVLSVIVRDPFRRPRDRYRAYDRFGRVVATGRRAPRAEPRFRVDSHRSRYTAPRSGRRGAAARPGERWRPTEMLGRRGGPADRRGEGATAARTPRRWERPSGASARGRQQAPRTRVSGDFRSSRRGGAAVTPDRGRVGRTAQGGAAPRRDPAAQRPTSNGRGQAARRATPRDEPRGARASAHPGAGGRGERRASAPAARRSARR